MQLDPGRLRTLEVFTEAELREIGLGSIRVLAEQFELVDRALADGNLSTVAEAAHRARNETQLVGALELSDALGSLEDAARAGDDPRAREAVVAARALWPATREAIERATQGGTG